jgi:hypothetical protein
MTSTRRVRPHALLLCGAAMTGLTACGGTHATRPVAAERSAPTAAAPHEAPGNTGQRDAEPQLSRRAAGDSGWKLMWSPQANKDGLGAFEGVENRGKGKEIFPQGNNFRFEMKVSDRDGSDRQRNEVKGMRAGGHNLVIGKGQTWRFTYQMFIPKSLRATTSFTHIMQFKMPGQGSAPILTLDLRRRGSQSRLELVVFGSDTVIGSTDLAPLQDKWIGIGAQIRFADKPAGQARLIVTDGNRTVVDDQKGNVDTWLGDRARPKWGIYRSIKDSADLRDTYLLLTEMKAYQHQ